MGPGAFRAAATMSALLGAKLGAVAGPRAQGVGADLTALTGARVHAGGPGRVLPQRVR